MTDSKIRSKRKGKQKKKNCSPYERSRKKTPKTKFSHFGILSEESRYTERFFYISYLFLGVTNQKNFSTFLQRIQLILHNPNQYPSRIKSTTGIKMKRNKNTPKQEVGLIIAMKSITTNTGLKIQNHNSETVVIGDIGLRHAVQHMT